MTFRSTSLYNNCEKLILYFQAKSLFLENNMLFHLVKTCMKYNLSAFPLNPRQSLLNKYKLIKSYHFHYLFFVCF